MAAAEGFFRLGIPNAEPVAGDKVPSLSREEDPGGYLPSERLRRAVDVALILGRPLLLMGPPGTGKSELARAVAEWFSCRFRKFETKSTSEARDLFYTYDSLAAFRSKGEFDPHDFIRYQALGAAILDAFTADNEHVRELLGAKALKARPPEPVRTVVLIDEIDKAPRDFPNDLLNEIERLYFRVPELHNAVSPGAPPGEVIDPHYRPIVIITSNDERGLPPAFLRRCAFFHIDFPTPGEMEQIVAVRMRGSLGMGEASALPPAIADILDLFYELRGSGAAASGEGPSTAELLDWIQALLRAGLDPNQRLAAQAELLDPTLPAIAKSGDAMARARDQLRQTYKLGS